MTNKEAKTKLMRNRFTKWLSVFGMFLWATTHTFGQFPDPPEDELCPHSVSNVDAYKTANGVTYDNVFVVNRVDDYAVAKQNFNNIDSCAFEGTLRWALMKANYAYNKKNRIVFNIPSSLKDANGDIVISVAGIINTYGLQFLSVDGNTQPNFDAGKNPIIKIRNGNIIHTRRKHYENGVLVNELSSFIRPNLFYQWSDIVFLDLLTFSFQAGIAGGFVNNPNDQRLFNNIHITSVSTLKRNGTFIISNEIGGVTKFNACFFGIDKERKYRSNNYYSLFRSDLNNNNVFTNCMFSGMSPSAVGTANTPTVKGKNLVSKTIFINNTKNIVYSGFFTTISGMNSEAKLVGTTSDCSATRVELYKSYHAADADQYIGFANVTNQNGVCQWVYDPSMVDTDGTHNQPLIQGTNYTAFSSNASTSGEFSQRYFLEGNCVVTNTNNTGDGSLRAAIGCATKEGLDTVKFAIPGGNLQVHTITLQDRIDEQEDPDGMVINGFTQGGENVTLIEIKKEGILNNSLSIYGASHLLVQGIRFKDSYPSFYGNNITIDRCDFLNENKAGLSLDLTANVGSVTNNTFSGDSCYVSVFDNHVRMKGNTFANVVAFVKVEGEQHVIEQNLFTSPKATLSLTSEAEISKDSVISNRFLGVSSSIQILKGAFNTVSQNTFESSSERDQAILPIDLVPDPFATPPNWDISPVVIYQDMSVYPDSINVGIQQISERDGVIEFFASNGKPFNAYRYLKSAPISGLGSTNTYFHKSVFANLNGIVATFTDTYGNTSEMAVLTGISPVCIVQNTNDSGLGSLREAVACANAADQHVTIHFQIPEDQPVVALNSKLFVTNPNGVDIDGRNNVLLQGPDWQPVTIKGLSDGVFHFDHVQGIYLHHLNLSSNDSSTVSLNNVVGYMMDSCSIGFDQHQQPVGSNNGIKAVSSIEIHVMNNRFAHVNKGIELVNTDYLNMYNNFFCTDSSGTNLSNAANSLGVYTKDSLTTALIYNNVFGNLKSAIWVENASPTNSIRIFGNYIGVTPSGTATPLSTLGIYMEGNDEKPFGQGKVEVYKNRIENFQSNAILIAQLANVRVDSNTVANGKRVSSYEGIPTNHDFDMAISLYECDSSVIQYNQLTDLDVLVGIMATGKGAIKIVHNKLSRIGVATSNRGAIQCTGCKNAEIADNEISRSRSFAIWYYMSDSGKILRNKIDSSSLGCFMSYCNNNLWEDNAINGVPSQTMAGIFCDYGNANRLVNNKIGIGQATPGNVFTGIRIVGGNGNRLEGNEIGNIGYNAVHISSSTGTVVDSNFIGIDKSSDTSKIVGSGVILESSPRAIVQNNRIANTSTNAIYAVSTDFGIFKKNKVFNGANGIYLLSYSDSSHIVENELRDLENGIIVDNGTNHLTMANNRLYNMAQYGIWVKSVVLNASIFYNQILNNALPTSKAGIALESGSHHNNIFKNTCRGFGKSGISVYTGYNNAVYSNHSFLNGESGIQALNTGPDTEIYDNYLESNSKQNILNEFTYAIKVLRNTCINSEIGIKVIGSSSGNYIHNTIGVDSFGVVTPNNYGIVLQQGASYNDFISNRIVASTIANINLIGSSTFKNYLGKNILTHSPQAISLLGDPASMSNNSILAPFISSISLVGDSVLVTGTATVDGTIELFKSSGVQQANAYVANTSASNGIWNKKVASSVFVGNSKLVATLTDVAGNTSELSLPKELVAGIACIVKNTNDAGPESFREALACASRIGSIDTVKFAISTGSTALKAITLATPITVSDADGFVVDGFSQSGGTDKNILIKSSYSTLKLENTSYSVIKGLNLTDVKVLYVGKSKCNTLEANVITTTNARPSIDSLLVTSGSHNRILNNTISAYAFSEFYGDTLLFKGNQVTRVLNFFYGNRDSILYNTFNDNASTSLQRNYSLIAYNTFNSSYASIGNYASYNTILENSFLGPRSTLRISIPGGFNNLIKKNIITTEGSGVGISLFRGNAVARPWSYNNTISQNVIYGNKEGIKFKDGEINNDTIKAPILASVQASSHADSIEVITYATRKGWVEFFRNDGIADNALEYLKTVQVNGTPNANGKYVVKSRWPKSLLAQAGGFYLITTLTDLAGNTSRLSTIFPVIYTPQAECPSFVALLKTIGDKAKDASGLAVPNLVKADGVTIDSVQAAKVVELNVSENPTLVCLKGIEKFTSLKKLDCVGTNIDSLDLSKNLNLEGLYCNNNLSLQSLKLGQNVGLKYLIAHSTSLSSLDISQNVALLSLVCANTNISKLDLGHNVALQQLDCNTTNIADLDLSKNSALTNLNCHATKITTLDLSHNTLLYSATFSNTLLSCFPLLPSPLQQTLSVFAYNEGITCLPSSVEALRQAGTLECNHCPTAVCVSGGECPPLVPTTCVVTDTTDADVPGSLRAAIHCANSYVGGKATITFAIPGEYKKEIKLKTNLPEVKNIKGDSIVLNGNTQKTFTGIATDSVSIVGIVNNNFSKFTKSKIVGISLKNLSEIEFWNGSTLENSYVKNANVRFKEGGIHSVVGTQFDSVMVSAYDIVQKLLITNSNFTHIISPQTWVNMDSLVIKGTKMVYEGASQSVFYSAAKINLIHNNTFSGPIYISSGSNTIFHNNYVNVGLQYNQSNVTYIGSQEFSIVNNEMGGSQGYVFQTHNGLIKGNHFGYSPSQNKIFPNTGSSAILLSFIGDSLGSAVIDSNFILNAKQGIFVQGTNTERLVVKRNVYRPGGLNLPQTGVQALHLRHAYVNENIFDCDTTVPSFGTAIHLQYNDSSFASRNSIKGNVTAIRIANGPALFKANTFESCKTGVDVSNSHTVIDSINIFRKNQESMYGIDARMDVTDNYFEADSAHPNTIHYRLASGSVERNTVIATDNINASFISLYDDWASDTNKVLLRNNTIKGYRSSLIAVTPNAANNKKISRNLFDSPNKAIDLALNTATPGNKGKRAPQLTRLTATSTTFTVHGKATPGDSVEVFLGTSTTRQNTTKYLKTLYVSALDSTWQLTIPQDTLTRYAANVVRATATSGYNTSELSNPLLLESSNGVCVVRDTTDANVPGSLRAAIHCANIATNGKPVISFAIPGDYKKEIRLKTLLPTIQNIYGDSVVVDGSTQASYANNQGDPVIYWTNHVSFASSQGTFNQMSKTRLKDITISNMNTLQMRDGGILERVTFKNVAADLDGSHDYYIKGGSFDNQDRVSLTAFGQGSKIRINSVQFRQNGQEAINAYNGSIKIENSLLQHTSYGNLIRTGTKVLKIYDSELEGYIDATFTDSIGLYNNRFGCTYNTNITTTSRLEANNRIEIIGNEFGGFKNSTEMLRIDAKELIVKQNYFGYSFKKNTDYPIQGTAVYINSRDGIQLIDSNYFYNIDKAGIFLNFGSGKEGIFSCGYNQFGGLTKPIKDHAINIVGSFSLNIHHNTFENSYANSTSSNCAIFLNSYGVTTGRIYKNIVKQAGATGFSFYSGNLAIVDNQFSQIGTDAIWASSATLRIKGNQFSNVMGTGVFLNNSNESIIDSNNVFTTCKTSAINVKETNKSTLIKKNTFHGNPVYALELRTNAAQGGNGQYETVDSNIFRNNGTAILLESNSLIKNNTFVSDSVYLNNGIKSEFYASSTQIINNKATALSNTIGSFYKTSATDTWNAVIRSNTISGYASAAISIANGSSNKKISRNILDHPTKAIDLGTTVRGNNNKKQPVLASIGSTRNGFVVKGKAVKGDSVEVFITNTIKRQKTSKYITTVYVAANDSSWQAIVPFDSTSAYDTVVVRATATLGYNTSELSNYVSFCSKCPCIVKSKGDVDTLGTLRNAIGCANGKPTDVSIQFNIPGPGPYVIALLDSLPSINSYAGKKITLDGATQWANNTNSGANPSIVIETAAAFPANRFGMAVHKLSEVKNLQFRKFSYGTTPVALRLVDGAKASRLKISSSSTGVSVENSATNLAFNQIEDCKFQTVTTGIHSRYGSPVGEGRFTCTRSYFWSGGTGFKNDVGQGKAIAVFRDCYFGMDTVNNASSLTGFGIYGAGAVGKSDSLVVSGSYFTGCASGAIQSNSSSVSIVNNYFGTTPKLNQQAANKFAINLSGHKRKSEIKGNRISNVTPFNTAIQLLNEDSSATIVQGNYLGYGLSDVATAMPNVTAIRIRGIGKHQVIGNFIYKTAFGIYDSLSVNDLISNNQLDGITGTGIWLEANVGTVVQDNKLRNSGLVGIQTTNTKSSTLFVNDISNGVAGAWGIKINGGRFHTLNNNVVFNVINALELVAAQSSLSGNKFTKGDYGITVKGDSNKISYTNIKEYTAKGVFIDGKSFNKLEYDTITNATITTGTGNGVEMTNGAKNNWVYGGEISYHKANGVFITSSAATGNVVAHVRMDQATKAISLNKGNSTAGNGDRFTPVINRMEVIDGQIKLNVTALANDRVEVFVSSTQGQKLLNFVKEEVFANGPTQDILVPLSLGNPLNSPTIVLAVTATNAAGTSEVAFSKPICPSCVCTVTNTQDYTGTVVQNSFRHALTRALGGECGTINFTIPSNNPADTIKLLTYLPQITTNIFIDASSQAGYSATSDPKIWLKRVTSADTALIITSPRVKVRGLGFHGFPTALSLRAQAHRCVMNNVVVLGTQYEYMVIRSNQDTLQDCYFGRKVDGTRLGGLFKDSPKNGITVMGNDNRFENCHVSSTYGYNLAFLGTSIGNRFNKGSLTASGGFGLTYRKGIHFGPGAVQNFKRSPTILSHKFLANGTLVLKGSTQSTTDVIQLYTGNGSSQNASSYLLGSVVMNDTLWTATLSTPFADTTQHYYFLATATDAAQNTSQLSKVYRTIQGFDVCYVTNTNATGAGSFVDALDCVNNTENKVQVVFNFADNNVHNVTYNTINLQITNPYGAVIDATGKQFNLAATGTGSKFALKGPNVSLIGFSLNKINLVDSASDNTIKKMVFSNDTVFVKNNAGKTNIQENSFQTNARLVADYAKGVRISQNTFANPNPNKAITLKNNANNYYTKPIISVDNVMDGFVYFKIVSKQTGDTVELFKGASTGQSAVAFIKSYVAGKDGVSYLKVPLARNINYSGSDSVNMAQKQYFVATSRDANWNTSELSTTFVWSTCVVTSNDNSYNGSLRYAINDVNNGNCSIILFNIPATVGKQISLDTELPIITKSVIIDATSQSGYLPAKTPVVSVITKITFNYYLNYLFSAQNIKNFRVNGIAVRRITAGISLSADTNTKVYNCNFTKVRSPIWANAASKHLEVTNTTFGGVTATDWLESATIGINSLGGGNILIANNTFHLNSANKGLVIAKADTALVESNVLYDRDVTSTSNTVGLSVNNAAHVLIANNTLQKIGKGILLKTAVGQVLDNVFHTDITRPNFKLDSGIVASYSNMEISRNTFHDWRSVAIATNAGKGAQIIARNTIDSVTVAAISHRNKNGASIFANHIGKSDSIGILLEKDTSMIVDYNHIQNARIGTQIDHSIIINLDTNRFVNARKAVRWSNTEGWIQRNNMVPPTVNYAKLDTGIAAKNSPTLWIKKNNITDWRKAGIVFKKGGIGDTIVGNRIDSVGVVGISIDSAISSYIADNLVRRSDSIGIWVGTAASKVTVRANEITKCAAQGLRVAGNENYFYINTIGHRNRTLKQGNKKGVVLLGNNNVFGAKYKSNYFLNNKFGGIENYGTSNTFVYNVFEHNDTSRTKALSKAIRNATDPNLVPHSLSYQRVGQDFLIKGKATANDSIHAYFSYGYPQDALYLMGTAKVDAAGDWSFLLLGSKLDTNRTSYLVATATRMVTGVQPFSRTSELSKTMPIGRCIISETDDVADNEFPLEGSVRAAVGCANALPERAQVITKIYPAPNAVLRDTLLPITNAWGIDWSGKNLAAKTLQRLSIAAVKPVAQDHGLRIRLAPGVTANFKQTNFTNFKDGLYLDVAEATIDSVSMVGCTNAPCVGVHMITANGKPIQHNLHALYGNNFEAVYKQKQVGAIIENVVLSESMFDQVKALYPSGVQVNQTLISRNVWNEPTNWLAATKVSNTLIAGNTFTIAKHLLPLIELRELVKVGEAETLSFIQNTYVADSNSVATGVKAIVQFDKAKHLNISNDTFAIKADVAAIAIGSDSVNSIANQLNENKISTAGKGILVAGRLTNVNRNEITTKLSSIETDQLVLSSLKGNALIADDTAAIKLNHSWRIRLTKNTARGNTGATKIIDIHKGKAEVSNRGRMTPLILNTGIARKSQTEKPYRTLLGKATPHDRLEVFLSESKNANALKFLSDEVKVGADSNWTFEMPKNWNRQGNDTIFVTVTGTGGDSATSELSAIYAIVPRKEVCVVENTTNNDPKSLRKAIECVNATDFYTTVLFHIDPTVHGAGPYVIELQNHLDAIYNYAGFHIDGASQAKFAATKGDHSLASGIVQIKPATGFTAGLKDKYALDVMPDCGDSTKINGLQLDHFPKGIRVQTGQAKLDSIGITYIDLLGKRGDTAVFMHKLTPDKEPVETPTNLYQLKDDQQRIRNLVIKGYGQGISLRPDITQIGIRNNYFDNIGYGVILQNNTKKSIITGNVFVNVDSSAVVLNQVGKDNAVDGNWFGYDPTPVVPVLASRMNNAVSMLGSSQNLVLNNKIATISTELDSEEYPFSGTGIYVAGASKQNAIRDNYIGWNPAIKTIADNLANEEVVGMRLHGAEVFDNKVLGNTLSYVQTGFDLKETNWNHYTGNQIGVSIALKDEKLDTTYLPVWGQAFSINHAHDESIVGNSIGNYGGRSVGIQLTNNSQKVTLSKNMIRSTSTGSGIAMDVLSNSHSSSVTPIIQSRSLVNNQYLLLSGVVKTVSTANGFVELFAANGNTAQAQTYIGTAYLQSDGTWSMQVSTQYFSMLKASYFVATYTYENNTSPFSEPFKVSNLLCQLGSLPLQSEYLVCPGVVTTLSSEMPGLRYQWVPLGNNDQVLDTLGAGIKRIEGGFKASISKMGKYQLTVQDETGACSKTAKFTFTSLPAAYQPDFIVHDTVFVNDTVVVVNLQHTPTNLPAGNTFAWDWGTATKLNATANGYVASDTAKYKLLIFPNNGVYTISQKSTLGTCATTMFKRVQVLPRPADGTTKGKIVLPKSIISDPSMYPNPVVRGNLLTISFTTNLSDNFSIFFTRVSDGLALQRYDFKKTDFTSNTDGTEFEFVNTFSGIDFLTSGMYFVRIEMPFDVQTIKLVIE